jgi:predicted dehydrogenase
MAKLRLGVIGAGSWTVASHLPNLARRADEIEFVGVNRLGRPLLEMLKDRYGFAVASEDYRDVLAAGIDICVVGSPAALHHEHARAALEAGAHVLVEKPVTIDPAQAWDLVETARRVGRHAVVSFGWNYRPMSRQARQLMVDGGIGQVENVTISMSSVTRELLSNTGTYPGAAEESIPEARTWTDPAVSGGGYGQAQLTHALGLALWLTDLRGSEAFAYMSAPMSAPVELHDAVVMRFTNGAIGTMSGASCHLNAYGNKPHQLEVRALGSEGQLHIDLQREIVRRFRGLGDDMTTIPEPDAGLYDCIGPVDALIDLAQGREVENCSPIELGARTVEILDAAYRSARSGVPEKVRT